jgi:hypothetical protein
MTLAQITSHVHFSFAPGLRKDENPKAKKMQMAPPKSFDF